MIKRLIARFLCEEATNDYTEQQMREQQARYLLNIARYQLFDFFDL